MAPRSGHVTAKASYTSSARPPSSGRWHYPTAPKFSISQISPSSPRGSTFDEGAASSKQVSPSSRGIPRYRSPPPTSSHPSRRDEIRIHQVYIPIFSQFSSSISLVSAMPVLFFHQLDSDTHGPPPSTTLLNPSFHFSQAQARVLSRTPSPEPLAPPATSIRTSFMKRALKKRGASPTPLHSTLTRTM